MGVNYTELREVLERKANKAIKHLDELKCFSSEFREVLDSITYISQTLQNLRFLDSECEDCKNKDVDKTANENKIKLDIIGKDYYSLEDKEYNKDRLVLFYSNHCAPCQKLKPILENVVQELNVELELILVDEPENEKHAKKYEVTGWPTVLFIKENKIQNYLIGADLSRSDEELHSLWIRNIKGAGL